MRKFSNLTSEDQQKMNNNGTKTERTQHQTQECIIEPHSEIRSKGSTETNKKNDNPQEENNQGTNQTTERREKEKETTNERANVTQKSRQAKRKNDQTTQQESENKKQKTLPKENLIPKKGRRGMLKKWKQEKKGKGLVLHQENTSKGTNINNTKVGSPGVLIPKLINSLIH